MRIAVAGNPNSGKTTVFNALSGLRQKVANYPGVTVEKCEGMLGTDVTLLDLPGTYSLSARSPDERIARDVLLGRIGPDSRPDGVLIVIDASNLDRNLYLASQILDFGIPAVIACNMVDIARRRGVAVDCAALTEALGVPVVPTVANRAHGIDLIRAAIETRGLRPARPRAWLLSPKVENELRRIATAMGESGAIPHYATAGAAVLWTLDFLSGEQASRASAEGFLKKLPNASADVLREAADAIACDSPDIAGAIVEERYAWIGDVVCRAVQSDRPEGAFEADALSDRIDRVATHRVFGVAIFAAVMFTLFLSIFAWAEPLMRLIERAQIGLSDWVTAHMAEGALRSLVTDAAIKGVGSVVAFLPQICILFLCLGILEDSGYMARAAFLMDRLMSRVGLHGKSFIPLLSCHACAIPAIMATRTIEDRRDRLTTILVAPLMSCSARLPVYIIVIAAVFGDRTWLKAGVIFGLYLLGALTALTVALVFKRTILAGPPSTFIMELPPYHVPRPWPILRMMWVRSRLFLTRAGTTIFVVCILIWALSYYPRLDPSALSAETRARLLNMTPTGQGANVLAAEQLRQSYIGRLGHAIEPAIRPLGFDWRIGVGVLSSFLAREVFVGTMGITFAVGDADETSSALRNQLGAATWPDGRPVLTPLAGVSLLIFYVLACQCASTLAVTRRETGSWRWPAFMFAYMSALAYFASLLVFQIGHAFGLGGA